MNRSVKLSLKAVLVVSGFLFAGVAIAQDQRGDGAADDFERSLKEFFKRKDTKKLLYSSLGDDLDANCCNDTDESCCPNTNVFDSVVAAIKSGSSQIPGLDGRIQNKTVAIKPNGEAFYFNPKKGGVFQTGIPIGTVDFSSGKFSPIKR